MSLTRAPSSIEMPFGLRERSASVGDSRERCFLIFDVAGQACAIDAQRIRVVQLLPEVYRPPSAFAALAGFVNIAGEAVPVLEASRLLGLPDVPRSLYTPVIVLDHRDGPFALIAERVHRLVKVKETSVIPLRQQHVAHEALNLDGQIVAVLDTESLLLTQEARRLAELRQAHQRRILGLEEVLA